MAVTMASVPAAGAEAVAGATAVAAARATGVAGEAVTVAAAGEGRERGAWERGALES